MSRKILITGLLFVLFSAYSKSQSKLSTFLKTNNYEVMLTVEPFTISLGYLTKISRDILSNKHFEGSIGLAFQNSYSFRTKFENNMSPDTRVIDYSFLLTSNWKYFPFKQKKMFLDIGLFGGITTSVSKGSLSLPEFKIEEQYFNRHIYFNYGSSQTFGWRLKSKYEVGLFSMISLKGILDSGRTRPAEVDSRFFVGLKIGYVFGNK